MSRTAARSVWKVPYISPFFFNKKFLKMKEINVWKRNSSIPFTFVDKCVRIYNGKSLISIRALRREMVGLKFGNFSIPVVMGSAIAINKALKARRKRREKLEKSKKKIK